MTSSHHFKACRKSVLIVGATVDSVKFSTRFVGTSRKVVFKWAMNHRNISYIETVKNLMVKKFAIASHHLRDALKVVVGWVRIEPRANAISHTNKFVMFSCWETQRNASDALHYKHQLNSHLAKGQCLIKQFTTYLLKGELGRRTDEITQDQIPNSIIHLSIYLLSIELVFYWNQYQRYLLKLRNLVLSKRVSAAKWVAKALSELKVHFQSHTQC